MTSAPITPVRRIRISPWRRPTTWAARPICGSQRSDRTGSPPQPFRRLSSRMQPRPDRTDMTAIRVTHVADSRYQVAVGPHSLTLDEPVTAGGDDHGPTPAQLFAASLVACAAQYAGSYLARHDLSTEGLVVEGDFEMADDRPARIVSLSVTITPPAGLPASRAAGLLAVASHCTVHNTLRQRPTVKIGLADRRRLPPRRAARRAGPPVRPARRGSWATRLLETLVERLWSNYEIRSPRANLWPLGSSTTKSRRPHG
jgi:uncharacterized OsmC-like protein